MPSNFLKSFFVNSGLSGSILKESGIKLKVCESLAFLKHFMKLLSLEQQKNPFSHPVYLTKVISLVTELIAYVYNFVEDFNL